MRGLPLMLARGAMLGFVMQEARQNRARNSCCRCCGAAIPMQPDRPQQSMRCPCCLRWQEVAAEEEAPRRLSAASVEALRRTKRWLRRL